MNITVKQAQGRVPVTILQTHGDLDASNFKDLIAKAQEVHRAGTRDILLDLGDTPFMSSSGLAALYSIAALVQGDELPDLTAGWDVFYSMYRKRDSGSQKHFKLLNPQPEIDYVLEVSGLKQFFQVYTNLEAAIASF
jgi:anti-anti-sigma factor